MTKPLPAKRFCPCGCGEKVAENGFCADITEAACGLPTAAPMLAEIKRLIRDEIPLQVQQAMMMAYQHGKN